VTKPRGARTGVDRRRLASILDEAYKRRDWLESVTVGDVTVRLRTQETAAAQPSAAPLPHQSGQEQKPDLVPGTPFANDDSPIHPLDLVLCPPRIDLDVS